MFFCLVFGFNPICILGEHDSTPSLEKAHFQYNFGGPDAVTLKNYCWMEQISDILSTMVQPAKILYIKILDSNLRAGEWDDSYLFEETTEGVPV